MESVWNEVKKRPRFEELKEDIKADVLIIGGGIAGILCAYMLKMQGVNCVVAESDKICSKTTQNTTAKITCQHGLIFDKMISRFGAEIARLYFESQQNAVLEYKKMSEEIACDFKEEDSFVYSLNDREKIEKEVLALQKIGCRAEFADNLPLPFRIEGAVKIGKQAQFHPLKFIFAIAKDIKVFENTKILEIKDGYAVTGHGKIKAEKIIVATHFPFINKYGAYFLKMYQHRSYVLALKDAPDVAGMYVDEAKEGLSFRNYNGMLLLGGGSHRTGKKGGCWNELSDFANKYYPNAKEVYRWATQDCMTLDDIPYIGQYSERTPNLYVVTGFNKWGMTSAMTAAILLTDLIQGRENKYARIYSPQRSILHPQLAINAADSIMGLLTPTTPRCPHLGCALKYNRQEHSWDCPCHGSRFTKNGKLIDNPATDDMNF